MSTVSLERDSSNSVHSFVVDDESKKCYRYQLILRNGDVAFKRDFLLSQSESVELTETLNKMRELDLSSMQKLDIFLSCTGRFRDDHAKFILDCFESVHALNAAAEKKICDWDIEKVDGQRVKLFLETCVPIWIQSNDFSAQCKTIWIQSNDFSAQCKTIYYEVSSLNNEKDIARVYGECIKDHVLRGIGLARNVSPNSTFDDKCGR